MLRAPRVQSHRSPGKTNAGRLRCQTSRAGVAQGRWMHSWDPQAAMVLAKYGANPQCVHEAKVKRLRGAKKAILDQNHRVDDRRWRWRTMWAWMW